MLDLVHISAVPLFAKLDPCQHEALRQFATLIESLALKEVPVRLAGVAAVPVCGSGRDARVPRPER